MFKLPCFSTPQIPAQRTENSLRTQIGLATGVAHSWEGLFFHVSPERVREYPELVGIRAELEFVSLEVVELDHTVHARLVNRYEAVAFIVPPDVEARLLLLHRFVVDQHSHAVWFVAVTYSQHDVDLRRLEVDEDVVFVILGDPRVAEVLQLIDP